MVIEDTAELHVTHRNVVRLEARRSSGREGGDDPGSAPRGLAPTRSHHWAVRGSEGYDLLEALTGHAGSLSTIHANSATQALNRFASCVTQSGVELPYEVIRDQISVRTLVVHLHRVDGRREVSHLLQLGSGKAL